MLGELLAALDAPERDALEDLLARLLGEDVADADAARHVCRLCDADACGHPDRCPVTQAAGAGPPRAG